MTLTFNDINETNKNLIPKVVFDYIKQHDTDSNIKVAEINPDFADGESLNREYGIDYEEMLNCLVVEGSRGEDKYYAALLVPYGKKAKTNATVKRPLGASKVGFADLNQVLEATKMEFGSITPVGLPSDWLILMDSQILEKDQVVVGGGFVQSKLLIPTQLLASLPNIQVVEDLAK